MTASVTTLAPIAPLHNALAIASETGDIKALKDIHATATALREGARARGMGIGAENQAAEVIIRAERVMGQALITLKDEGMLFMGGRERREDANREALAARARREKAGLIPSDKRISLADLDVSAMESHKFQMLASIPEEEFEARFGTVRDSGARIAKVDFYRLVKGKGEVAPEAERPMHGDGFTPAYSLYRKAHESLLVNIELLPADELTLLAADIRALVNAYNAERARR